MADVVGWAELMAGQVISAVWSMWNSIFFGWTIAILFFTFQIAAFIKTKNATLCWVGGLFFAAMFGASTFLNPGFIHPSSVSFVFIVLVFELAAILFSWLMK